MLTRRQLLVSCGAGLPVLLEGGQQRGGMASRHVPAQPRRKLSGLPFHSKLTNIASSAGLRQPSICGHADRADYVIEAMGCGVAFFDYDNDGWLDVLVLSGSRFGDPPPDASTRLYKNNRNGTFTDVTQKAGLFASRYSFGVTIADFDNDGFDDIFITGWPQNTLYRNNGDGTFTDVTKPAGLLSPVERFGTGCTFIDFDRDGKLDLFVSNYLAFDVKAVPRAGQSKECNAESVFCGPRGLPFGHHSLYHNNGDGTFTDVTAQSGIGKVEGGYGLTAVAADFDEDGWQDIYLACDSTPSLFFHNNGDGTFTEQALERGVALSEDGMEQAGMGVACGDPRLLGRTDIVKTHFAADTPVVYANNGQAEFRDDTLRSGLGVENRFISWGVGIQDLDNDGQPDIFWVTGGIYPELRNRNDEPYATPAILFRNLGAGRFEELNAGYDEKHCSRGCAFGDFDNDGDMDILIMNLNEPPSLLRNDVTGSGQWVKVLLTGTRSNRSAIGARVTVQYLGKTQTQIVTAQSSYLSVNDRRLHFGLGDAKMATLHIRWPSGALENLGQVPLNRLLRVTEGSGSVRAEQLR